MPSDTCKSLSPPPKQNRHRKKSLTPPNSQIGISTTSNNAANDPTAQAGDLLARQLRDGLAATSGYPELTVYVNYAHGDEKLRQKYGERKLPRLVGLKKKWDPRNVFRFNNDLPTQL